MDDRRRDDDPNYEPPSQTPDRFEDEPRIDIERFDERIDVGWNPPVERRRPGQGGDDHDG